MLRLFSLLVLLATAATVSAQSERDRVLAIIGASNAAGIALNADFASAPAGTLNWEWRQQETVEEAGSAATQQLHQGLARFNWPNTPTNPQWIDLSTDTGANSCGARLGQFGGLSGSYGHSINQVGVTIEMVVKFHAIDNWAKPFDFNTGPGVDEMTWTWDGDSDGVGRFLIEQYVNASRVPADFDKGAMEFFRPALNQWYHLTQVMVPDVPGGEASAVWYIYVNGQKLALADALIPGASHTPLQSANYPLRITRPYQYIARSGWAADPYMRMTVDALRVYDFKLSDEQIGRLATMYGLNNNDYAIPAPSPAGPPTTESQKLSHISFAPAYSLDFETNPASAVGGTINWQWLESDPTDTAADQARHRGIAKLNGGANNFIDLMKASGPQSAGKVIPTLFTNSPGEGAAHGWTIEMVVRPDAIQTWSKYFCMGTGPYYDAIYIGWIGGDNLWEGASYNNIRDQLRPFNPGQLTFYRAPTLGKWTHLTWVIRPLNIGNHPLANYSASWSMFVDGELVTRSTTNANYPLPLVRRQAYLGASVWPADVPARIAVDAFRVWDRALSAEQIQTITTNYGIENSNGGDWNWNRALGTAPRPVYDLDFQQNPTDGANEQPVAWVWSEQDPADSTVVAGLHTGLAIFDGTANSWVNLSANVGPNRVPVPMVMPNPIGGIPTQRPGYQQGWSFETVVKSTAWRGWSKFFVISNGADEDEIILGYDGSGDNIILQNYIRDAVWDGRWNYAESELRRPFLLNKWYHIVLTFLPGTIEGGGNWRLYINGEQLDWASDITPNMTLTELQGATYPRESIRTQSFLGKSTWNDPTSRLLVDAFRIYDYALTLQQVQLFSQAYGTYEVPPRFPADQPISVSQESQNWQSAPGITRAPIFNGVFSVNPVSYVGGRTDYQWMEVDPADDPATQNLHKGLLVFNGSDAAWADLTVATGPKSIGQVMPMVGGRGSGTGAQRGMTFELVVKLTAVEQWAKLIQLAAGPGQDSLIIGWNNDRPFNTIEVHNMARVKPGLQRTGAVDLMSQPPLNQWLFITVVMQLTDDVNWRGSWVAYESGNVIARHDSTASTNPANFPMKVHRQYATFAKSAWDSDSTATMLLDMARIYDYALTEEQVRASVSLYGMYGSSRPVQTPTNVTLPMPDTDESVRARAAVTRAPVFNAWFPTDPAQQVNAGRALSYRWLDFDPADSVTERANHRGIIDLSGDPNSYIDMNTNAGPNSCGVVVPIIGGPGSATGADAGWTFELVFKIKTMISWVKLFNLGNGPELNNIILGVDGTDHTTMAFEVFDREVTAWSHGFAELFQPELNRWYHVVIQVVPTVNTTQGAGIWYFYVNGNLLAYTDKIVPGTSFTPVQGASYPKAVYRRNSYIGKSNWNDPTFQGYLDAFRIYDYRLTATQIRNLADVYGLANSPVRLPSVADNNPNVNPASQPEVRAWDRDGIPEPVFNGNFAVDPRIALGGATSSFEYSWMSTDPADTPADQNVHKGMIHLNNAVSSWIQLSKATGSRSVGLVIPTLFDVPQADEGRADRGWTVEVVCKLHRQEVWSKIVNFATGGSDWMDSWAITWNGDNRNRLTVQNYNNLNPVSGQPNELGFQDFLTSPVLNKWYHLVIVMQPYGPKDRYAARWRMYVDGVLMQTAEQNMPLPVVREDSFIGASQWGDQDPKQLMLVDALRIYNKGLSSAQVRSLAMMYGNNPPQPAQDPVLPPVLPPVDPGSFPPAPDAPSGNGGGDASSSSKSKLSGGAIAGIVIGSVVGAAILCLILFCLFAGGSRMGGSHKATSDPYKGEGKYGQMEASKVEESQTGEVHDEEIEMGETNA